MWCVLLILVAGKSWQKCCLLTDLLISAADGTWVFEFSVKFYPPEPSVLQEELTRLVDIHRSSFLF